MFLGFKHLIASIFHILLLFLLMCSNLFSQSLDNISKQKPFTLSGTVSTNQVLSKRPIGNINKFIYNSYYTGNLNLSIYGISMPFTYTYTNQKGSFSHSFNQFGLHPSYKWIKGHIGYASMNFSPYTMNGHLFLGIGVEVNPKGILRASAFVGRLRKAVMYDSTDLSQNPSYKRMGCAIKIGVEKSGEYLDLVIFSAKDITSSVDIISNNYELLPEENVAMSLSINKSLFKNIRLTGEFGSSLLTKDMFANKKEEGIRITKPINWFMTSRTSTISRNALKANLTYIKSKYSIGLGYERIDPDYRTLGAYYFTNNMENTTINLSAMFFKSKLKFSSNFGLQKDNLNKTNMANTKRFVGGVSINATPNKKIDFNLSYSNFTSYTNVKSVFDYINETDISQNYDTLNFRQISHSTNLNINYRFKQSKNNIQSLNSNFLWQKSGEIKGEKSLSNTNFYNATVSYSLTCKPINVTSNISLNFNMNESKIDKNYTFGPSLGVSKSFLKNTIKTSFNTSYNEARDAVQYLVRMFNYRLRIAYSIKKKHNLSLNFMLQKNHKKNAQDSHNENATLTYVYYFNVLK